MASRITERNNMWTVRLRTVLRSLLPGCCPQVPRCCVWGVLFSLVGSLLSGMCLGEETRGDREEPESQDVMQVEPNLYYVEDDLGRLIPVPGFRYRDFIDLVRLRDGLPAQPEMPGVILEKLRIKIVLPAPAEKSVAYADINVECVMRSMRQGWNMLPIQLPELIISEPPVVIGDGEVVVTIDPSPRNGLPQSSDDRSSLQENISSSRLNLDKGFLVWVNERDEKAEDEGVEEGEGETAHTIVLKGQIPVDVSLDRDQLSFTLPAATDSKISIETQRRDPLVKFNAGVIKPAIQLIEEDDDAVGSVVEIRGAVGPTRLQIEEPLGGEIPARKIADCKVESVVRIDGRLATIKASFALTNLGQKEGLFTVQLPSRSVVRSVGSNAKILSRGGSSSRPQVVVRVNKTKDGNASFELVCERAIDTSSENPIDVGGFSIEEVPLWRQWGQVSISTAEDWTAEWKNQSGNRRIDAPSTLSQEGFVAAFAFDSQPMSLPLRVLPRKSQLVVEPEYVYHVSRNRLELSIRLQAVVRGVAAKQLSVLVPGWKVEAVGPSSVVDSASVSEVSGVVTVPFNKPIAGEVVVELQCSQYLDPNTDELRWVTPIPEADLVGPARMSITSESDIEIVPDTERITGMSRQVSLQPSSSSFDLPRMSYRVQADKSTFVATRRILDQQIDASVTAQVNVGLRQVLVQQAIRLNVAHVPLQFVEWMVPQSVAETGRIEVRFNGQLLTPEVISQSSGINELGPDAFVNDNPESQSGVDRNERDWRVVRVLLPSPLFGSGELVTRYSEEMPEIPEEATVPISIPLLLPTGAIVGRQSVTLSSVEELNVDVRDERWNREGNLQTIGLGRTWNTSQGQKTIDIAISQSQSALLGETVVEATWVRTTLRGPMRSDQWAFAVTSASDSLTLMLPIAAEQEKGEMVGDRIARARVNRSPWSAADEATGRIDLDLEQTSGTHLVEVEVRQARKESLVKGAIQGLDWISFQRPAMPSSSVFSRVVWEIVVPDGSELLWGPQGWTSQQVWDWRNPSLKQKPAVSIQDLASWVTAASSPQPNIQGSLGVGWLSISKDFTEQRRVFCDVGSPSNAGALLVPWWLLVLAASGIPLIFGGVVTIFPRLTTLVLVVVSVVFVCGMAIGPTLTLCILRASLPGLVFAVPAGFASWWRLLLKSRAHTAYELDSWEIKHPESQRSAPQESVVINMRPSTAQTVAPVASSQSKAETE